MSPRIRSVILPIIATFCLLPVSVQSQDMINNTPDYVGAWNHAYIMTSPLRQQSGEDEAVPAKDRNAHGSEAERQAAIKRAIAQRVEARKRVLVPMYERRLREDGKASADAWLTATVKEIARRDAEDIRRQYGDWE